MAVGDKHSPPYAITTATRTLSHRPWARNARDGVYLGFRAFFGRLSYAVQAAAFAVVHGLTGFAATPRSPQAILGIRLHQAGIPAVLLLAGFFVFKALNTITPESARRNREVLREKGW